MLLTSLLTRGHPSFPPRPWINLSNLLSPAFSQLSTVTTHPSSPPRSNFSVAHSGARRKNWKEVRPALDDIPPMSPAAIQKEADSKASAVLRAMVDPTVMALKAVAMAGGCRGGRRRAAFFFGGGAGGLSGRTGC